MRLTEKGYRIAQEQRSKYEEIQLKRSVHFNDVYNSVDEMLAELKAVNVVNMYQYPYRGYQYIHGFNKYLNKGWELSEKQLIACKMLAQEIHIAYLIRNEYVD